MCIFTLLSIFPLISWWRQLFILVNDRKLLGFMQGCTIFHVLNKVHTRDIFRRINIKLLLSLFARKLAMLERNMVLLMG